jgi:hypothetical protein
VWQFPESLLAEDLVHKESIALAFLLCSLGVRFTICCNAMRFRCAANVETHTQTAHAKRKCNRPLSNLLTPTSKHCLRAVYTRCFCVRFSVRDGATAQLLPFLFHVRDCARKAKEAVGWRRHRGRRNGRKKRECRRPLNV